MNIAKVFITKSEEHNIFEFEYTLQMLVVELYYPENNLVVLVTGIIKRILHSTRRMHHRYIKLKKKYWIIS